MLCRWRWVVIHTLAFNACEWHSWLKAGWPQNQSGCCEEDNSFCPHSQFSHRTHNFPSFWFIHWKHCKLDSHGFLLHKGKKNVRGLWQWAGLQLFCNAFVIQHNALLLILIYRWQKPLYGKHITLQTSCYRPRTYRHCTSLLILQIAHCIQPQIICCCVWFKYSQT
jgi:hypothetical protein